MNLLDTVFPQGAIVWDEFSRFIESFEREWRELGRQKLQQAIQDRITQVEACHTGARQIRSVHYHTRLGTIELKRRIYPEKGAIADQELNLPPTPWLPGTLKLACALGVCNEFAHAQQLFTEVTGVEVSDRTIANQVEAVGERLAIEEKRREPLETAGLASALARLLQKPKALPRLYVGVDGIMVPMNQKQGNREGLVGVLFWERDHRRISEKRAEIRRREYVTGLTDRRQFTAAVYQRYTEMVKTEPCETIVLGDGAHWIWQMAETYFPRCVQILDFFHVSEYVWHVARSRWPEDASAQKRWVMRQQKRLKESKWLQVIEALDRFQNPSAALQETSENLRRYLTNNAERIDYKRYLALGYMIGSGVVESSNRRVVTQRLKQSGMHWSLRGANSVMTLRASFLSHSQHWLDLWSSDAA